MRRLISALAVLAALPLVLSVGFGFHHRAGALEQALLLGLLSLYSHLYESSPFGLYPSLSLPALLVVGIAVRFALLHGGNWPQPVKAIGRLIEFCLLALGLLAAYGVFAVGISLDRPLFWVGVVLMLIGSPWVGSRGWREELESLGAQKLRAAALLLSCLLALVAGSVLLEGPGSHSPVFRWGEIWLAIVGGIPILAGGIWLTAGLGLAYLLHRRGPVAGRIDAQVHAAKDDRGVSRWLAGACFVGLLIWEVYSALSFGRGIAQVLSAAGLLIVAQCAGRGRATLSFVPGFSFGLALRIAPWGLWASLCAARGLLVGPWLAPQALPVGFERLSEETGVFALSEDRETGRIFYSDRDDVALGLLATDGEETRYPLEDEGVDAVEELIGPVGSVLFASTTFEPLDEEALAADYDDGGFHLFDLNEGLLQPLRLQACLVSSIVPIPGFEGTEGGLADEVLVGCEGNRAGHIFNPGEESLIAKVPLEDDLEAGAFHPDGKSFYGVSLWGLPEIFRYRWPSGELLARREIGSFNWEVAVDRQAQVFVPRFFEGRLLVLDPESLETRASLPLSFGARALVLDDQRDRLWVSASYSGLLWEIDTKPPYPRRAHPICGQARDLLVDARGRLVVATDCGIVRLDPEQREQGS